jgi:hypothetical protein
LKYWFSWRGPKSPATPILRRLLEGLQRLVGDPATDSSTILLCHSPARFLLRRLLEGFFRV